MAKKHQPAAVEALNEIQGAADKLAEWIQAHLWHVASGIGGVLALAGIASYLGSMQSQNEEEAAAALAETRGAYMEAMGASPGSIDVPELANKEAAARIRGEFTERFETIAVAHPGTISGALAQLEVAQLALDVGEPERALGIYDAILAEDPPGEGLEGMVRQRSGQALEELERWTEAAARHQEAAALAGYPLRHWALADAARCLALAGDKEGASALYRRLDTEAPDLRLPDHQRAQKRELEAAAGL